STLQVSIGVLALADADAVAVGIGTAALAHCAPDAADQVGPVGRPLSHARSSRFRAYGLHPLGVAAIEDSKAVNFYREVGERGAHAAGSLNEATSGVAVTCPAGSSTSSRYSSTASARLASASSMVWPWLATSTSRHCAMYQSSSRCRAAVMVCGEAG